MAACSGIRAGEPETLILVIAAPSDIEIPERAVERLRAIARAANAWLADETGRQLRMHRDARRKLSVQRLQLARDEGELRALGDGVAAHLATAIDAGMPGDDAIVYAYLGRVELSSRTHCGRRLGRVAGLFLENEGCRGHALAGGAGQGWDKIFLHELFHVLGAVPACAPHQDGTRHVNDSPADLMHPRGGGPVPRLDVGRDDYFAHGRAACPDLSRSALLE